MRHLSEHCPAQPLQSFSYSRGDAIPNKSGAREGFRGEMGSVSMPWSLFKIRRLRIGLAALSLLGGAMMVELRADPTTQPTRQAAATSQGFAVVELFTSEGCSSCPPADAVLADLVHDQGEHQVYALAFHVDYWDRLGWADPFASSAFTDRQTKYANTLNLQNLYTPQAIVNGSAELVGSDRKALDRAIADAVAVRTDASITAATRSDATKIDLTVTTINLPAGTILNATLVEDGLVSEVQRGENGGRRLLHEHVVRSFSSSTLDEDGCVSISLPIGPTVKRDRASVVLFAQRPVDLRTLAATKVDFAK